MLVYQPFTFNGIIQNICNVQFAIVLYARMFCLFFFFVKFLKTF